MREIKFRGKRTDNNKWIYGDLLSPTELFDEYEISDCNSIDGSRYDIDGNTIGQYTGLKDKNGKEIYEGDILKYKYQNKEYIDYIVYNGNMFTYSKSIRWDLEEDEVIGNIYENPELLS